MLKRQSADQRATERALAAEHRIREVLRDIGPLLHLDPTCVQLVRFDHASGDALLRVQGSCPDCGLSPTMLREGIAAHVRARVAEVREIHIEDGTVSRQ